MFCTWSRLEIEVVSYFLSVPTLRYGHVSESEELDIMRVLSPGSKNILKRGIWICSTVNAVHLSNPCFLFLMELLTKGAFIYNRVLSFVDWNWIQLFLLSMSLVSIIVLSCVVPFLISQVNVY